MRIAASLQHQQQLTDYPRRSAHNTQSFTIITAAISDTDQNITSAILMLIQLQQLLLLLIKVV